jgi:uncharacterized protein (DUF952 family)
MKNLILCSFCLILASCAVLDASHIEAQSAEKSKNLTEQKEIQMNHENQTPQYLYKIVSPEEWQESLLKKQVVPSLLDKDFFHLATENQLPHIAQKFWNGKNYMILKLDSKKLMGRLVYETNPGGTNLYSFQLNPGNLD